MMHVRSAKQRDAEPEVANLADRAEEDEFSVVLHPTTRDRFLVSAHTVSASHRDVPLKENACPDQMQSIVEVRMLEMQVFENQRWTGGEKALHDRSTIDRVGQQICTLQKGELASGSQASWKA